MADLCLSDIDDNLVALVWIFLVIFSTSVRCSLRRVARDLPVSHKKALHKCNYLTWTFDKVKDQQTNKGNKSKKSEKNNSQSKGMVVLPYVQGTFENLQRVYRKYNIATAFKPHITLRKSLVHPKDKRDSTETTGCVYEISCKNCDFTY